MISSYPSRWNTPTRRCPAFSTHFGMSTLLPRSVERFVTPGQLAQLMREAGLWDVQITKLGLGTVTIHVGRVP